MIAALMLLLLVQNVIYADPSSSDSKVSAELPLSSKQKEQLSFEKEYLGAIVDVIKETFESIEAVDEYGEFYIDNEVGLKFVLALAKEDEKTDKLIRDIDSLVPSELFIVEKVKYSKQYLVTLAEEILSSLQKSGKKYNIETSVKNQKVYIKTDVEDSIKQALEIFVNDYDGVVEVVDEYIENSPAATRGDNHTKLGGGIAIDSNNCSTAVTATKGTNEFLLTAGHCFSGTGATVKQNSTNVGVVHLNAYGNLGTDVALIKLTDTTRKITNGYYYSSILAAGGYYDKSYTSSSTVINGQLLCKAGIKTNVTCGTVIDTAAPVTYTSGSTTINLTGLIKVQKDDGGIVLPGDSGGIVFNAYRDYEVVGIVSGNSIASGTFPAGYYGYMTKIGNAIANGGAVTLYTSSTEKSVDPNS